MNPVHPGESLSIWTATAQTPLFSKLKKDIAVDVCIIGGGIAGLTTAYLLASKDKKVCVLESFEVGGGQTCKTTAQCSSVLDERYYNIEKVHGQRGAQLVAQSHLAALNEIERIVAHESIDCELTRVDGYLFSSRPQDESLLYQELDAAHRAGLLDAHINNRAPFNSFDTGACLRFPQQVQLHPIKYLHGLADGIIKKGSQIYTNTHVTDIKNDDVALIKTSDGHTVKAKSVVVATNSPINDMFAIHTKQAPYRTYVIAGRIPKGNIPKGFYWDTDNPYHYIRTEDEILEGGKKSLSHDLLLIGGEDHKTGQKENPEEAYDRLEEWARSKFPLMENIIYRWSGQVMVPVDAIGFLGHNPLDKNNIYVITGDAGNGMTHGTIGAMLITDQILGIKNSWEGIYNPSRISLRSMPKFIKENANVAAQYSKWAAPSSYETMKDIPPGEGAVINQGIHKIAVYKHAHGELETLSAVCPHLGCIVAWNKVENSWDCPCHGSRFDCHGQVLEGPAVSDLKALDAPTAEDDDASNSTKPINVVTEHPSPFENPFGV